PTTLFRSWAIATIGQTVFIEGLGAPTGPFLVLLATMLLRVLLARVAQGAAASVAEAIKLRLRAKLAEQALARGPLWLRGGRKGALVELSMAQVEALDGHYAGYLPEIGSASCRERV